MSSPPFPLAFSPAPCYDAFANHTIRKGGDFVDDKICRFEDLPQDLQDDFRDAPFVWKVRVLRSSGWPDEAIKSFLGIDRLPPRDQSK